MHELTPNPLTSVGTFYVDTPTSDPIPDSQQRARSTQPQLHITPFKNVDGDALITNVFYPSLDFHLIELGITITNEASAQTILDAAIPSQHALEELDRVSEHYHTLRCSICRLNRVCNDECCGPIKSIRSLMNVVITGLAKNYTKRSIALLMNAGLDDFLKKLYSVHNTWIIPANTFVEDLHSWFDIRQKKILVVGESLHFPVIVDFKSSKTFMPQTVKRSKNMIFAQRRH